MSAPPPPAALTLVPETAPFSPEQRAWLNGFLAGWLGIAPGEAPSMNGIAAPAAPVPAAEPEEDFPWHDPALPIAERLALAEDRPKPRLLMAAMAQLDCGACGYQCRTYAEAIASGAETSLTLCSPGGRETSKALKQLLNGNGAANGSATNGHANGHAANGAAVAPPQPLGTRGNPARARVLETRRLNGPESEKHTTHVVLDLSASNLTYEVGDSLGVFPLNCPELAEAVAARLTHESASAREEALRALRETHCLRQVTDELLELFAAGLPQEQQAELATLSADDDALATLDVLDLLERFPAYTPPAAAVLAALGPLQPRLYSIASSLKKHAGQVHLTVGRASSVLSGRERKGVASTMFAERLEPGAEVRVFVQPAHGFRLPEDSSKPVIMVGPGTGIAPFRAFLQEREASGASGPNWLLFGEQRAACDFHYRQEFEALRESGLLTRFDTAFSRDQQEKIYVQHRIAEQAEELYRWLEQGAYFYVCGDARRMAADVDAALREAIARAGGLAAEEAQAYVDRLKQAGRYLRDVY